MGSPRVHIAFLSIAIPSTYAVEIESIVADAITAADHEITAFEAVRESEVAIRAQLVGWIADPEIDLVIVIGGGQTTATAMKSLVDQTLPGFGALLRVLAAQAGAVDSVAEVVCCGSTFVFVLPTHANAVRAVIERLILPQLDRRAERGNLIACLPRLSEVTRVDVTTIDASLSAEARKLSGRAHKPTGKNVIARKIDDPTKPIDIDKLQHQLELSTTGGDVTKPAIDLDALHHALELSKAGDDVTKPMDLRKPSVLIRSNNPIGVAESTPKASPAPTASTKSASAPLPSVVAKPASRSDEPLSSAATAPHASSAPHPPPASSVPMAAILSTAPRAVHVPTTPPPTPASATVRPSRAAPIPDELETIDPDELHDEPDDAEADDEAGWLPRSVPAANAMPAPVAAPIPASTSAPVQVPAASAAIPATLPASPTALAELSTGSFDVPDLKRRRTPLVVGLLILAIVVGGGAFLFMNGNDDAKPRPLVAQASVDAVELDAAVAQEVEPTTEPTTTPTADPASEAKTQPEIEIEPDSVSSPKTKTPGRHGSRRKSRSRGAEQAKADKTTPQDAEPEATTPDAARPPSAEPGCGEVDCVLEHYARACCERFKPAGDDYRPGAGPPENLQKAQIKVGMAKIRAKVMACGEQFPAKGTVKLAVIVDPEGHIAELSVQTAPAEDLGNCVATAARKATFAKTEGGGSFTYPFVF